jgi:glycosyltransferase involved in cell wall biosynthesis
MEAISESSPKPARASAPTLPLSVIIPCFNEEAVIADCLESVKFADEIMVVDSFSTDRTLEIARRYTSRVLQHEYINSAAQKNWAIPQARHPWVLIVDSDERVTPELAEEIQAIVRQPECDGYWIRRRNFFLGKEIRHGSWRTDRVLRLFRRDSARYQNKHVHAEIELPGRIGWCRGLLNHYSYRSLDDFQRKVTRYTTWGALNARDKGVRGSGWRIFGHTAGHFLKGYVLKRGFLDGTEGLVIALMDGYLAYLKYARLWEMQRGNSMPHAKDAKDAKV